MRQQTLSNGQNQSQSKRPAPLCGSAWRKPLAYKRVKFMGKDLQREILNTEHFKAISSRLFLPSSINKIRLTPAHSPGLELALEDLGCSKA